MRLLIVEDETDLAQALQQTFEEEGFSCDVAEDGRSALFNLESWEYDAVVLDLMLPAIDGGSLLERLRCAKSTPVLVLTARDTLGDKVALLNKGADDYVTKPFELSELIARVRALVRRSANHPRPTLDIADISIDTVARRVEKDGTAITLTPREFALLEYLVLHRGELVTRTQLYDHLYNEHEETLSNVVDVYVSNIRRKLGRDLVRTRREGYIVDA